MRPDPVTIFLGNKTWTIRPLTLKQIQEIEPLIMDVKVGKTLPLSGARAVIEVGLRRDYVLDIPSLGDLETTQQEIDIASQEILRIGGWIKKESTPGEAEAAIPAASNGDSSILG